MFFKKQMNFNSIFDDSYNNYANSIQYDTKYYKQNWPSVYSQEESCQVSNNLNLCSVEKGHDFNRNIENFCDYYCIWNTQFQDEQLIEPLNQLVMNNFWCWNDETVQDEQLIEPLNQLVMNNFWCWNDETVGNSNMSIPRSTLLIQNSIPKIYQESENNRRSGNFIGDFKSEANSQQDMNSKIENTSMIKRKDYGQINSKIRSLASQPM